MRIFVLNVIKYSNKKVVKILTHPEIIYRMAEQIELVIA